MKRQQILNDALFELFLKHDFTLILGIVDTLIRDQNLPVERLIEYSKTKLQIPESLSREILSYYV